MQTFIYDNDPAVPPDEHQEPAGQDDGKESRPERPRWHTVAAILLVIAVCLAGLGFYAHQWGKSTWVKDVIISGNHLLTSEELEKNAEGLLGRNLEDVDGAALAESYETLPYIREAEVVKEMNGIVRVRVEERIPMAKIASGEKVHVIDREGYILPYRNLLPFPSVYLRVTGMKTGYVKGERREKADEGYLAVLKEMIDALSASEYARFLIREVILQEENKTYFAVAGSPTVFIVGNEGGYKEKLKKFEIFWQKVVAKKGLDGYEKVDLRFADKVFAVENSRHRLHRTSP